MKTNNAKTPAKFAMYANLSKRGGHVAWLANVIFCHHSSPARELRNLAIIADRVVGGDFDGIQFNANGGTVSMTWGEFGRATAANLAA